jgi:hypothetical protein
MGLGEAVAGSTLADANELRNWRIWADIAAVLVRRALHTLLDLRGPIPSFIHISEGKMGDAAALDLIVPEAGAIYVMDRGYVDFRRLHTLHQAGAFFVTRTKINMNYHRVSHKPLESCRAPLRWQIARGG